MAGYIRTKEFRKMMSDRYKGIHFTPQTEFKKGHGITEETRKKMRLKKIGTRMNWKGGISNKNHLERCKFQREIQKSVFERDNYTCQMCGERGGNLHVDHIQSFSEYVEGRFSINNCRTLCVACHYQVTFGRNMPKGNKWGSKRNKRSNLCL